MATLTKEEIKNLLGKTAAALPQDGMVVGLGTGTTAHYFITHLSARCKEGLSVTAVASSEQSARLAQQHGLRVISIDEVKTIDLTVDGADEIDGQRRMIKGGGGALLREKIVAFSSQKVVIIADESKVVEHLGKSALPIEIAPFGCEMTRWHIEALGYLTTWRKDGQGNFSVTDNGHYILDIIFPHPLETPEAEARNIAAIPGVLETGFFFDLADEIFIGHGDGRVTSLD